MQLGDGVGVTDGVGVDVCVGVLADVGVLVPVGVGVGVGDGEPGVMLPCSLKAALENVLMELIAEPSAFSTRHWISLMLTSPGRADGSTVGLLQN